ncbi:AtpZ/AtpI family protein [Rhabdobacter roseus]|uniref:ATP synthase protein I n=1 Tax=Rhabdobacter roseus TaxID=1655419 RepID=A0A840TNT0_9BACT|nr:AtpZ/AtpI family protein [Rhabdobacter roseus]MBB5285014.1 ATP synthase protein I [Rhabdobacter roseus]
MNPEEPNHFSRQIEQKAERKLTAQRQNQSVWFGLGMFGLVGWSVAIPALIGTSLGVWLDRRYPQNHSWTLSLLVVGLMVGCVIAWQWLGKEDTEIHQKENNGNDE